MFTLNWTAEAQATYGRLKSEAEERLKARRKTNKKKSSKTEGLFKQVHKALQFLAQNPKHPGLHTHQYLTLKHPFDPKGKVFEAYAQNDSSIAYRIFWCYGPAAKHLTIIAITPHP